MSLLDEIKEIITEVFSDEELFFYPGTYHPNPSAPPETHNPWAGEQASPSDGVSCLCLITQWSDQQRASLNIPGIDVKILIIENSIPGRKVEKGDVVEVPERGAYAIGEYVRIDPSRAIWICQASPAQGTIEETP